MHTDSFGLAGGGNYIDDFTEFGTGEREDVMLSGPFFLTRVQNIFLVL